MFVYPYPMQAPEARLGVIFMAVRKEAFHLELRARLSGADRPLTISRAAGGEVLFSDVPQIDAFRTGVRPTSSDAVVTEYVSDITGYRYRIETPRSHFSAMLNSLRLKSALVIALLFAIGMFLNWIVSRYNSRPLRLLLGKFAAADAEEDFLSVETLLAEQQAAEARARRDVFLMDLMRGAFATPEELRARAGSAGLDFSGEAVAFVEVNGSEAAGEPVCSPLDEARVDDTRFYRLRVLSGNDEVWAYSGSAAAYADGTRRLFARRCRFRPRAARSGAFSKPFRTRT